MNGNDFIISNKQCYQIASNIYLDIADYIKNNQEEYNNWLNKYRKEKKEYE